MNIFYASTELINSSYIELTGQEAVHASRVLRHRAGDEITVVDGQGGWYEGTVAQISNKVVQVQIDRKENISRRAPQLVLGLGIIKKRDRLEFAVEKAVELGASALALFRGEHTVKTNVRMDRLESIALSAMKQSLQAWLPEVHLYNSVDEVIGSYSDSTLLVAHEKTETEAGIPDSIKKNEKLLLMVGPEGGFSDHEVEYFDKKKGHFISLGRNRLRAETAAVAFMSQFI